MSDDKIYLEVGHIRDDGRKYIDDERFGKTVLPNRELVIGKMETVLKKRRIFAVYEKSEIDKDDLIVIGHHTKRTAIIEGDKEIEYHSFTHDHFFETLKNTKERLCKENGLEYDGTIFGKASKKIIIPEQIIPSYEEEIFVEWNCWDDLYCTDEKEKLR